MKTNNISTYKAVSENAIHSDMQVADKVYSQLEGKEIRGRIDKLGKKNKSEDELFNKFQEFLE